MNLMSGQNKRRRRSIRLRGYDYSQPGAYFVTICTHDRQCLFGDVVDGAMVLNPYGKIVWDEWFRTAEIRPYVHLYAQEFVVMPNHIHGIIWIVGDGTETATDSAMVVGATGRSPLHGRSPLPPRGPLPHSLGSFIAGFKSAVTKRINEMRGTSGAPVWQRNYYEHIIRNDASLQRIRRYIAENPLRWHLDRENPGRVAEDDLWDEIFAIREEGERND